MHYLSDLFLKRLIIGEEEAAALAAYLLWEAQEYDPYCGKYGDIVTLKADGGISILTEEDIRYWQDHFKYLKSSLKVLPLLSVGTHITEEIYEPHDHLQRLINTIKTLSKQQKERRIKKQPEHSALEKKLATNLRKTAMKAAKRSASRKSKDRQ